MRPTTTPTGRTAPSIRQHPSSPSQQRLLTSTPSASTAATGSAASSTNTRSPHNADGVFGTHRQPRVADLLRRPARPGTPNPPRDRLGVVQLPPPLGHGVR